MTKKQRRKIYEQVLWCIGDDFGKADPRSTSVCGLLWDLAGKIQGYYDLGWPHKVKRMFPEFSAQQPKSQEGIICLWWALTPYGNAKRRIALERAIALTY